MDEDRKQSSRPSASCDDMSTCSSLSSYSETCAASAPIESASPVAVPLPMYSWSDVKLDARINSGSFCMVLKAKHGKRKLALKCLKEGQLDPEQRMIATDDLREEARILSTLNHPHIVSIQAMGNNNNGRFFFLMERLQDETLETRLRKWNKLQNKKTSTTRRSSFGLAALRKSPLLGTKKERVPSLFDRLFDIGLKLGQALDYLHQKQIIHCDMKPSNVGFDAHDGTVKLFDFGLSKDMSQRDDDEEQCCLAGSYRYMAPEIMQAQPISLGADIYSFSLMLWELATLEKPHIDVIDVNGLTDRVVHKEGRPCLERIQSHCLQEVLRACWRSEPLERPNSGKVVRGLMEVLSELQEEELQSAREDAHGCNAQGKKARSTSFVYSFVSQPRRKGKFVRRKTESNLTDVTMPCSAS